MNLKNAIKRFALYFAMGVSLPVVLTSCDDDVLSSLLSSGDTVSALKEALTIGAQTAATTLGEDGGYLNDVAVKIGVPEEAQAFFELANTDAGKTFLAAAGAEVLSEDMLVQLMNQAAEKAAPESVEIFADAITSMTISDGENILFGADNAATEYLHEKTYSGLQQTFGSVVTSTFDQVSVSGYTLNTAWNAFSSNYNKIASFKNDKKGEIPMMALKVGLTAAKKDDLYNKIDAIQSVNTNLGEYVTGKALDGLFVKVADKEKGIRTNVAERTSELLQRVFGQLDNK